MRNLIHWGIVAVVAFAGVAIIVTGWPRSAFADDTPACYDIDAAVAAAKAEGGEMLSLIDLPGGVEADQLLVVELPNQIAIWGAKKGCMVGAPIGLVSVKKDVPA